MKIGKILLLLMLLTLTACRSSKTVTGSADADKGRSEQMQVSKLISNAQQADCVTAKIHLDLEAMGKNISVAGRLRMKRDEVIQLSLSLLGFEVGRLEFMPQQVLVVDRVNRQYVRADYAQVEFLQQANLDFNALQSLFWNELFIPGQHEVGEAWQRYRYDDRDSHVVLALLDAPKLNYEFLAQKNPAVLNRVVVQGKHEGDAAKMEWTYDKFTTLDRRLFPAFMRCQVTGLDKSLGFSLSMSRLDNDGGWDTHTQLSSRYKERSLEEVFGLLMGN